MRVTIAQVLVWVLAALPFAGPRDDPRCLPGAKPSRFIMEPGAGRTNDTPDLPPSAPRFGEEVALEGRLPQEGTEGQGPGPAEKKPANGTETITLQYRIKLDAVVSSGFVAVMGKGMTLRLKITWDIPAAKKKELDALIDKLEKKQINGVEFECKGKWISKGSDLRVTTVPKVTARGKARMKEGERGKK